MCDRSGPSLPPPPSITWQRMQSSLRNAWRPRAYGSEAGGSSHATRTTARIATQAQRSRIMPLVESTVAGARPAPPAFARLEGATVVLDDRAVLRGGAIAGAAGDPRVLRFVSPRARAERRRAGALGTGGGGRPSRGAPLRGTAPPG